MMIEIADVAPGDIILCRPKLLGGEVGQIADAMGLPYVHACICCSAGEVAHASATAVERRSVSVLARFNQNLAIFRSLAPWSEVQVSRMNQFVTAAIDRGVQFSTEGIYDYCESRPAHDERVVEAFFSQESLPEYPFDSEVVFCSEFVAQCCAMSGRFSDEVTRLFRPNVQSPKDIISDSAFACQFVGYLVAADGNVDADDPFIEMQPWSDFVSPVRTVSKPLAPDEEAIQDLLSFQRREVENFNAVVDSDSLLIRFQESLSAGASQTASEQVAVAQLPARTESEAS